MSKKLIIASVGVFVLGIAIGFWKVNPLQADSPENPPPGNRQGSGLVKYDEVWLAAEAYVTTTSDAGCPAGADGCYRRLTYQDLGNIRSRTQPNTGINGKMEGTDSLYPDFFVAKWRVHGNIHFE
jgi:hypothetical protein